MPHPRFAKHPLMTSTAQSTSLPALCLHVRSSTIVVVPVPLARVVRIGARHLPAPLRRLGATDTACLRAVLFSVLRVAITRVMLAMNVQVGTSGAALGTT